MSVFALLFGTFVFYRAQQTDLYKQSQATLDQNLGALNTLLLLSSSWFVAFGVCAVRRARTSLAPAMFAAGFVCGLGFVAIKCLEYGAKLRAGIAINTNNFYAFYFMLTGLHFVHVVLGLGVLCALWAASRAPLTKAPQIALVESGAIYWHMVDVLWIALFPLLYLLK
jgi:nitric oxide reductase NorE protein